MLELNTLSNTQEHYQRCVGHPAQSVTNSESANQIKELWSTKKRHLPSCYKIRFCPSTQIWKDEIFHTFNFSNFFYQVGLNRGFSSGDKTQAREKGSFSRHVETNPVLQYFVLIRMDTTYKSILYRRRGSVKICPTTPGFRFIPWDNNWKSHSLLYTLVLHFYGFYTWAINVLNGLKDSCCDHLNNIKSPLCLFLLCLETPWILKTAIFLVVVMIMMMLVTTQMNCVLSHNQ